MKMKIIVRLAIMILLLILGTVIGFAEIGIATAFDITFDGMSYVEYMQNFYSVPWHTWLASIIGLIVLIIGVEVIYRNMIKMTKN